MSLARPHLRFWFLLGLLGLALLGGGWWCLHVRGESLLAREQLAARSRELESLRRRQRLGAASNALEQTQAELARAEETGRTLRAALGGAGTLEGGAGGRKLPATRTEAFFELSEFVGEFHERARVLGVTIRPGESFGFATYAQTGPELAFLADVHRQQVVIQHFMTALLESRPAGILAVQRERPRSRPEAESRDEPGTDTEDYFEMDAARTTTVPGIAEMIAFRVKFTGFTPVLRDFLNRLQQEGLPLMVRAVEVEPAAKPTLAGAENAATRPVFAPQLMQFTVTIEHILLLAEDAPTS